MKSLKLYQLVGTAVLLACTGFSVSAHACITSQALSDGQKAAADTVFIGHAVGLAPGEPAVVTFAVEQIVTGQKLPSEVQVYWQNGMFGESASLQEFQQTYGLHSKVGILQPATIRAHITCSMDEATNGLGQKTQVRNCRTDLPLPFYPDPKMARLDRPWIIGDVCTPAYIEPAE